MNTPIRLPHAVLDLPSRRFKGLKIESLLGLRTGVGKLRMLEIGTGSGGIAHYFAAHESLQCEVDAVDVVDSRLVSEGYRFTQVEGTQLPFADASFDVILSNHVIEHVGGELEQMEHLAELRRVMSPNGVGYLAVPNRWMLVEPHYRLAFLSWLPRTWRSSYLRAMRKGTHYDCEPLEMPQLERMLESQRFLYRNECIAAARLTFQIERPDSAAGRVLAMVPDVLLKPLRRWIPTLIYTIRIA